MHARTAAGERLPGGFAHRARITLALVIIFVSSGCAALSNSAEFYKDRRAGPINWRQYTSD